MKIRFALPALGAWIVFPFLVGTLPAASRNTYLADNPNPPSQTVRLIFIHHSTGENWLSDDNGGLGIALRDNNYYVSDTNYGWGPEGIGDTTDIGHFWNWFRGPQSGSILSALYAESEPHCSYSRRAVNPGGQNQVILFKSCFPNSALRGSLSDPVPAIGSNPLRGEDAGSDYHTLANAKGIYLDLRNYFQSRPDKLFLLIAAPPLSDATYSAHARALNNWLVQEWLSGYPLNNVAVFDFYNVLTTNGGNPNINDLNSSGGNHHRYWQSAVQHKTDGDNDSNPNILEYPSGDDHPSQAGNLKATAEFIPLLNIFYNRWAAGQSPTTTLGPVPTSSSTTSSIRPTTSTSTTSSSTSLRPTTTTSTVVPTTTSSTSSSSLRPSSTTSSTSSSLRPSTTTTVTGSSTTVTVSTSTSIPTTSTTTLPGVSWRFFPKAVQDPAMTTGLAVVNAGEKEAEVLFRLWGSSGAGMGSARRKVPAGNQLTELLFQMFPGLARIEGWLSMESSLPEADGFFLLYNDTLTLMDGTRAATQALQYFVLPVVDNAEISLVNPSEKAVSYSLFYVAPDGVPGSTSQGTIPPQGRTTLLSGAIVPAGTGSGYLAGEADGGLSVVEYFGPSAWKAVLPALPSNPVGTDAPLSLYAAQCAMGGDWSTAVYLVNLEDHGNRLTLQLMGDDGRRLGSPGVLNLAGRGSARVDSASFFGLSGTGLTQGYVHIRSEGGRFTGAVRFSDAAGAQFGSALPLLSGGATRSLFHHVAQDALYYTGLAAINLNDQPVSASLAVYDAKARQLGTASYTLPAGGRFSRLLSELIPSLPPMTGGYFELRAPRPLAAFALFGTRSGSVLAAVPSQAAAGLTPECHYPSNFSFVEVPNPVAESNPVYSALPAPVPEIGACFKDSRFQTTLRRATRIDGATGRHEYSRFDPFNRDQTLILLLGDPFHVYRTAALPFNQPANWVSAVPLLEPRWDRTDPSVLWGLEDFRIRKFHAATLSLTTVKDFSKDPVLGPVIARGGTYRVTTLEEGEASLDGRYWALFLQGDEKKDYAATHMFTWDRQQDKVLGLYEIPAGERDLDWIGMSPLGEYVLIGGSESNRGNLQGLTMADKGFTRFHRLDATTAHSDVGLDIAGREIIVMQNVINDYIDLIPIDWKTQPILQSDSSYGGTQRTPLLRLFYASESSSGLHAGVHISCNTPGYCLVSTSLEAPFPEQNWLDRSHLLLRLDPARPRAFYLAKVYNTCGAYFEETHGSITNDGSMVVWADNWGQQAGKEQVFLMQLLMPADWRSRTAIP